MILTVYQGFSIKHTISDAVILIKFYLYKVNLGMTLSSDLTSKCNSSNKPSYFQHLSEDEKNNICNFQGPSGKYHIVLGMKDSLRIFIFSILRILFWKAKMKKIVKRNSGTWLR